VEEKAIEKGHSVEKHVFVFDACLATDVVEPVYQTRSRIEGQVRVSEKKLGE